MTSPILKEIRKLFRIRISTILILSSLLLLPLSSFDKELKPETIVVLLGTGTPFANPEKSGPALAIIVNDTPYIVDSGPGVVRRATAAFEKGIQGLEVSKLNTVFITHLHSDHTAGLSDLFLTPAVLGRSGPLTVYGPTGIKEMTDHISDAYRLDIDMRIHGLEKADSSTYKINATEIEAGVVFKDNNVTVTAFKVNHGTWPAAYGYRFDTADGKSIVVSGDCTYSESVVKNCNECDVLIHEVYSMEGLAKRDEHWKAYHSSFHTSTAQLAKIASISKPKKLILHHQLVWSSNETALLKEIKALYNGEVVNGKDLDIIYP